MGAGDAGSVMVDAPQITMTSGAQIASTTSGTGKGGSVEVGKTTPEVLVLDGMGTQIAASTTGQRMGGNVTVSANGLTIEGGAQIASSAVDPARVATSMYSWLVTSYCRIAGRRSPRNRPAAATPGRLWSPPPEY
jgi:hypothetical protein